MIWIATAATFGLVVCLVVYIAGSRIPRPSVMERIGGHGVLGVGGSDDPMRIRCAQCGVVEDLNPVEDHEAWLGHKFQAVALADSEVADWLRLRMADAN